MEWATVDAPDIFVNDLISQFMWWLFRVKERGYWRTLKEYLRTH